MTFDITKILYASTLDTFKNVSSSDTSITVPSATYSAQELKKFSTTVSLSEDADVTQLSFAPSFDSTKYYINELLGIATSTFFSVNSRATVSGSTLTIDVYVFNNDGGSSRSLTGFTIDIQVRRFKAPFE